MLLNQTNYFKKLPQKKKKNIFKRKLPKKKNNYILHFAFAEAISDAPTRSFTTAQPKSTCNVSTTIPTRSKSPTAGTTRATCPPPPPPLLRHRCLPSPAANTYPSSAPPPPAGFQWRSSVLQVPRRPAVRQPYDTEKTWPSSFRWWTWLTSCSTPVRAVVIVWTLSSPLTWRTITITSGRKTTRRISTNFHFY